MERETAVPQGPYDEKKASEEEERETPVTDA